MLLSFQVLKNYYFTRIVCNLTRFGVRIKKWCGFKCPAYDVGVEVFKKGFRGNAQFPNIISRVFEANITIWSRDMANDDGGGQETGSGTSQMVKKNTSRIMAGQGNQQDHKRKDRTGDHGKHHQKEKIKMDGACLPHGRWQASEAGNELGWGEGKEEGRESTGRRQSETTYAIWSWHGKRRRRWQWTEGSGRSASPDVQICTGRTKV